MSVRQLPVYNPSGGTAPILAADTAANGDTAVVREADGSVNVATCNASRVKSTGDEMGAVVNVTTTYTAGTTPAVHHTCDATGGAFTITLPAAAANIGLVLEFVKSDSSGNAVTLKGNGAELINGSNTNATAMAAQYGKLVVRSNGTKWHIIG